MLPLPLDPLRAVVVEGQLFFLAHSLWFCDLFAHHLAVFLRGHPLGGLLLWLLLADDLLERLLLHLRAALQIEHRHRLFRLLRRQRGVIAFGKRALHPIVHRVKDRALVGEADLNLGRGGR